MESMLRTMTIFLSCMVLGSIIFFVAVNYYIYRRNIKRLNAAKDSQMIRPSKFRFVLSWFAYGFIFYILAVLFLWLYEKELSYIYMWLMPLMFLITAPAAYPYYIVAASSDKVNGATRWGWLWKRTEIRLDEIDKEKLSRQRFGKKLGVTVIYSTNGTKILTLGLSEQQLSEIVMLAKKASEQKHGC